MYFLQSLFKTALLASLAFTTLASPINKGLAEIEVRDTPPLPTVDECKDQLKDGDTLFYSGPSGYASKARQAIKSRDYLEGYEILAQKWKDSNWQNQWQNDEQASKDFFNICSQALAEKAEGTAYVMLPSDTEGTDFHPNTVWTDFEWPHIPDGVKVIRINPDDADDQETIKE
ncbi:hypothetical protein PG997_014581 [Apiospora hydei]|uniref:Uncharacterized protein n=1 Tax=Apiospora hydei TaxID=1337664 RepID=A0ABR1UU76_9PEZI